MRTCVTQMPMTCSLIFQRITLPATVVCNATKCPGTNNELYGNPLFFMVCGGFAPGKVFCLKINFCIHYIVYITCRPTLYNTFGAVSLGTLFYTLPHTAPACNNSSIYVLWPLSSIAIQGTQQVHNKVDFI